MVGNYERSESIINCEYSIDDVNILVCKDSLAGENYEEYEQKIGRVKTKYKKKQIERKELTKTSKSNFSIDINDSNLPKTQVELIFKIIWHQMEKDEHPIRMIIDRFSKCFVKMYKDFVNKKNIDAGELYNRLELTNLKMFSMLEDGDQLKTLHLKKKRSEKEGRILEADKTKVPTYFLFNQVIRDIHLFIKEMIMALISFYSIVCESEKLMEIQEELVEWVTDHTMKGNLHKVVFAFFKLESEAKKLHLIDKYKNFINIKPEHWGIDEKFALNLSSPIIEIYEIMSNQTRINSTIIELRNNENDEDNR